jgi:hypothetical protein
MTFEVVEAVAPERPVGLEPHVDLAKRLGAKLVPATLRVATDPNEPGLT